jgi:UDP-hydrolysing UDP-N-acetyl-D-glucosamine 2-epimerase
MIRILAATGCRSDFDLLSSVYGRLARDPRFQFGLIVGGAHLSERYGRTVEAVRATGLPIVAEIDAFVDSDDRDARPRTAAHWISAASKPLREFQPDLILACGDREDALAACTLAAYLRIPTAHFFGGDHGETRDVDNLVRHACSKLASLHFAAMQEHADRLTAMGEPPERIHVVGNPALDAFRETPWIARDELLQRLGAPEVGRRPYAVVVHHPSFSSPEAGAEEIELILGELGRRDLHAFVGLPNVDFGSRRMLDRIQSWSDRAGFHALAPLPRGEFVNLLRHAAVLVGNSSLGLLEAPSVPLAAVNVGVRQRGRTAARNVLFVDADADSIQSGLTLALSEEFQKGLEGLENPYGDGRSSERIVEILARGVDPDWADKTFDPLRPRFRRPNAASIGCVRV